MDKKQILVLAVVAVGAFAVGMLLGKKKGEAKSSADGDFTVDKTKRTWAVEGGEESKANMLEVSGGMKEVYGNMLEATGPGTPIDPKGGRSDLHYPKTNPGKLNYPKNNPGRLNYPKNGVSNMLDATGLSANDAWPDNRRKVWG